jgi:hypothetical protein
MKCFTDLIAPQLQSVNSIRLSLDGSVLVTASATDKLQVWHLDVLRKKLAPAQSRLAFASNPIPSRPSRRSATGFHRCKPL